MKVDRNEGRDARDSRLVKVLAIVAGVMVLTIIAGTAYGLASGTRARKLARAEAEASAPAGSLVFSGIGTIRAKTKDKAPALVVATVSFPYPADDKAFAEELETKKDALRSAATSFFSRKGAAELGPAYEGATKAALRDSLNEILSLGKVGEIWISDFSVLQ
jgi:flagellar basal body-associated protein FliL